MQTLKRTLSRIVADLSEGRHLESYALALVSFALAIVGLVADVVPDSMKLAVILAAVGLLVFQSTKPERQPVDLDSVLSDRQSFRPFREFIRGGKVLWVYGASGGNSLRQDADIKRELLDRGGQVRILMQNPASVVMDVLPRQYDDIHPLRDDIQVSLRTLQNLAERQQNGAVEYALLDYNPGFSLAIIDPDGPNGRLVVEFHGYDTDLITDRMHIEITRQQSQHWFAYWTHQFEVMWEAGKQP